MQIFKKIFLFSILVIVLSGSTVFAEWVTTTWNNPNTWISNQATISAQKVAENFEYLKARTNPVINFSYPPICTGENKVLQWDSNNWLCITL